MKKPLLVFETGWQRNRAVRGRVLNGSFCGKARRESLAISILKIRIYKNWTFSWNFMVKLASQEGMKSLTVAIYMGNGLDINMLFAQTLSEVLQCFQIM